ncbi:hypothetical protein GHU83_11525, partial [Pseudomonas aeruginosa]|nr:hypothetical protein [Pseudomonas aeruginosa]
MGLFNAAANLFGQVYERATQVAAPPPPRGGGGAAPRQVGQTLGQGRLVAQREEDADPLHH